MEINYKDSLLIVRGALSKDQCASLISEYEKEKDKFAYEQCDHAITGELTQSTFKRVCLNPGTKNFDLIHSATKTLIQQWLEYLESKKMFHTHTLKRVLKYSHMYRLLKYEPGGWIHPHIDWDHFVHASCTFNLNEDYIGGQFSFFNGKYNVELKTGDALIFPADPFWVHEVKEVISGARYSTNSFITSLPDNLRNRISSDMHRLGDDERVVNEFYYRLEH